VNVLYVRRDGSLGFDVNASSSGVVVWWGLESALALALLLEKMHPAHSFGPEGSRLRGE